MDRACKRTPQTRIVSSLLRDDVASPLPRALGTKFSPSGVVPQRQWFHCQHPSLEFRVMVVPIHRYWGIVFVTEPGPARTSLVYGVVRPRYAAPPVFWDSRGLAPYWLERLPARLDPIVEDWRQNARFATQENAGALTLPQADGSRHPRRFVLDMAYRQVRQEVRARQAAGVLSPQEAARELARLRTCRERLLEKSSEERSTSSWLGS